MRRAFFTRSILIVSILIITLSSAFAEKLNKKLKKLEAYYEQARQDWKVPGMAIAIVKNDSLIFARGFGVKDVDSKEAVDANTLFAIASNTKAFTATALLMLAEEGKLSIDDKGEVESLIVDLPNPDFDFTELDFNKRGDAPMRASPHHL